MIPDGLEPAASIESRWHYRLSYGIIRKRKDNGLSVFNSNKSLIEVTGQSSHASSADGRGFEPLNLMRSLAFETSAIDRSANRP